MSNKYLRQMDYIDSGEAKRLPITLIGAGGIGSWVAIGLSKTGFKNIKIFDDDKVEEHNVSNQGFSTRHEGSPKVDCVNDVLSFFGEEEISASNKKFGSGEECREVVIMGVDSIEARKEIFESLKENMDVRLVIDGRMGLTTTHIYCVNMSNPEEISRYEESLKGETVDIPCTARATMSTAMLIGSMITSRVVNYLNRDNIDFHTVFDTKSNDHIKIIG